MKNISATHQTHELNIRPSKEGFVTCEGSSYEGTSATIGLITFKENSNEENFYIENLEPYRFKFYNASDEASITCVVFEANFDITVEWYRQNGELLVGILSGEM